MSSTHVNSTQFDSCLYVSIELSKSNWKLAFVTVSSSKFRLVDLKAGDFFRLESEFIKAKQHFGLALDAPVVSCYEAGRDGFWIHRKLTSIKVTNFVIESSSLEVDRRQKQRKTDRLDARKMVFALRRYHHQAEQSALRPIRVPSPQDEDLRNLQRCLQSVRREKRRLMTRIKGLLFAQGICLEQIDSDFESFVDHAPTGDGRDLGKYLAQSLKLDFQRLQLCVSQIRDLESQRAKLIRSANQDTPQQVTSDSVEVADRLLDLRGIGAETAWTLSTELFSWRQFRNRKQLAALVGLVPTPFSSGQLNREQGISKSGRSELRALLVEVSWLWLRYQPESRLSRWYEQKVRGQGKRVRRIAIVALARKLLIALWKYSMRGEVPDNVIFKTDQQKRRLPMTKSLGGAMK